MELKPCPFCGNIDDMRFTVRFKNDRRKVNGIYYKREINSSLSADWYGEVPA